MAAEETKETSQKKEVVDNPKGHSIDYLAKTAAEIRWNKHTARAKVAEGCEISVSLLGDLEGDPKYIEEIKNLMISSRKPGECLKWIERYGPEMPTRFGRRMGLEPDVAKALIDDVSNQLAPAAAIEAEEAAKAKKKAAEAKAAEKAKAVKAKDGEAKKDA